MDTTNYASSDSPDARLRVLLVQLPVPANSAANVPLAAGYLRAAARAAGLDALAAITILPRALADHAGDALLEAAIVAQAPQVLGLSLYTWNSERTLALALRLKQHLPGLLVVGGGPEVQHDNIWLLAHPALDLAVVGEGEQVFVDLIRALATPGLANLAMLANVAGLLLRDTAGAWLHTGERPAIGDLGSVPSPYLAGDLELVPGGMIFVEVSRWCPYSCSFCLYGRNMGPKLGGRCFPLARVLAEVAWGRAHGATSVHFVEANLNLVPIFRDLVADLAQTNADRGLALYAELRGEHLGDTQVAALVAAGLCVAEVGLQTANPAALHAAQRKTDLAKWAAGTRRLKAAGVDVLLDVILGLPEDDEAGVQQTIDFIRREHLGEFDVFTLQLLPGTAVRRAAATYAIAYQPQPPYYVLGTDRLSYADLRRLRRTLKDAAGVDPDAIEGLPARRQLPHLSLTPSPSARTEAGRAVHADVVAYVATPDHACITQLANHVDVHTTWPLSPAWQDWLVAAIVANPSTLFDLTLVCTTPPDPAALCGWRAALPDTPGYLDRVAVFARELPEPDYVRVSPRLWLQLPWSSPVDTDAYAGLAGIEWTGAGMVGWGPP